MKEKLKKKFEGLCKQYKIESDLIDFDATIDSTLTLEENFEILHEIVIELSNSKDVQEQIKASKTTKGVKHEREMINKEKLEVLKKEEENAKQELSKAVETILTNQNSNLNRFFEPLKNYVKSVANSDGCLNSLFVVSEGGIGKSTVVLSTLTEEKKKFVYVNNYTTTLELVNFLYEHRNEIIVFDDTENIFNNKIIINILKGALWGIGKENKRIVTYLTTDQKLKSPRQFEFSGKCFFLLNKKPNDNDVLTKALLTRSLVYEMNFDYKEIMEMLAEFSKLPYKEMTQEQRQEVYNYIKENTDISTKDINFRTTLKIYDLYLGNKLIWKDLSKNLLKKDEKIYLLHKFINESSTIKEAEQKWTEATGYCRKSFYNLKGVK